MKTPRVPMEMVGGVADFPDLFLSLEDARGHDRAEAEKLLGLLPSLLRDAPCFLDRFTKVWLYDFGEPVSTVHGHVMGVGLTFHPLVRLIDVVACVHARLSQPDVTTFLKRLADPAKHPDMLFELAPILLLDSSTSVEYEVSGESPGNRRVDWRIEGGGGFGVLLEVKSRQKDLIRGFERIQAGELDAQGRALPPDHDTDLLFKSVESKFLARPHGERAQGVWVGSALMQEEGELEASFHRLDPERVHFAVLASWGPAAHVLVHDESLRPKVVELLQLRELDGFVFERSSPG